MPDPTPTPTAVLEAAPLAQLRPEVAAFAMLMEAKLRENDHKRGWKDNTSGELMDRLHEEARELEGTLSSLDTSANIGREAADVANFAMMIADVCGALNLLPTRAEAEPAHPTPPASGLLDDYNALAVGLIGDADPVGAIADTIERRDRVIGDQREALGDIARTVGLPEDADAESIVAAVEQTKRSEGDGCVALGFLRDENRRLRGAAVAGPKLGDVVTEENVKALPVGSVVWWSGANGADAVRKLGPNAWECGIYDLDLVTGSASFIAHLPDSERVRGEVRDGE